MHDTRYIPLIICFLIYLGITFGYFHTYKNKRWLYLIMFSAAFLLSTVPHYLFKFIGSMMDSEGRNSYSNNVSYSSNNNLSDDFDSNIIQQREEYFNNQAEAQSRQAEINANSMGFYSAEEARRNGMDV